ncbi:MAG: hypothetical protein JSW09_07810, partial [Pseudomonadota bacterium]
RLMEACQQAEEGGLAHFLRERYKLVDQISTAFDETLTALRGLFHQNPDGAAGDPGRTLGS